MDGLLLVDKPKGWTSFDVVAKVRGVLRSQQSLVTSLQSEAQATSDKRQATPSRKVKVGHTGTLDPLATGLLVLAIGKYTKKVPELTVKDKIYECTMNLGFNSTTDDAEGTLTQVSTTIPTLNEVKEALMSFVGEIEQIPPQFSAIKVGGVRSYSAARKGETVKLEPRKVVIKQISEIDYNYPVIKFVAHVGSGTYIRSLARDAGNKLQVGAYLSDLRRTKVGDFLLINSVKMTNMDFELILKNILTDTKPLAE